MIRPRRLFISQSARWVPPNLDKYFVEFIKVIEEMRPRSCVVEYLPFYLEREELYRYLLRKRLRNLEEKRELLTLITSGELI